MTFTGQLKGALDILSAIALIVAAIVLVWVLLSRPHTNNGPQQARVQPVDGLHIPGSRVRNVTGTGHVAIVEFSDFQCPYCATHARTTLPAILRHFVDSGQARYVALHFPIEPIHPLALEAGEAAECAAQQGRFWDMHERLFLHPQELDAKDLRRHAQALDLDEVLFGQCMDRDEALGVVRADQAEGQRLGVGGTPAFFIGRVSADGGIDLVSRIRGAVPLEVCAEEIGKLNQLNDRRGSN
jgi:protein-disulfide isomerase